MSRGKYQSQKHKFPWVAAVLILIVVLSLGTGTVFAYLRVTSGPLENGFSIADDPSPTITDDYAVNVGNPGYSVYVRAAIVVTWQDGDGKVLGKAPVPNTDYTLELNSDWFQKGGFYYYSKPVQSGSVSPVRSFQKLTTEDGYTLHVEIVAQTIQALGTTDGDNPIPAVTAAWGIAVEANGNLKSN